MKSKICVKCKIEKSVDEFNKHKNRKDGLQGCCKMCSYNYGVQYYKTDRGREIKLKSVHKYQHTDVGHKNHRDSNNKYKLTKSGINSRLKDNIRIAERTGNKRYAYRAVRYALVLGILTKEPCTVCGITKVEGHHENYKKPLDVQWLCQQHHNLQR